MNSEENLYWVYKIWRHIVCKKFSNMYRYEKKLFFLSRVGYPCAICGKIPTKETRSVDHIIPASVLFELELGQLLLDQRNFRLTHRECNRKRGDTTEELPDSVKAALDERRLARA